MKWISLCIVLMCIAAGCMNKGTPRNSAALDVGAPAQPQQYQPAAVAVQPMYDTTMSQPVTSTSFATSAGGKYTVRKGDTLWSIALTKYGNGNQWQKIASANPGLSAETLKAGQTIAVP